MGKNKLALLVIHCLATPEGKYFDRKNVHQWHIVDRGWKQYGYSDIILLDGSIEHLVDFNDDEWVDPWEVTNGARGHNSTSRHVSYVGGLDVTGKWAKDTRTKEQRITLTNYVLDFLSKYPEAKVCGHNQLSNKACPSFSVPDWLRSIGVAEKNIK